MYLDGEYFKSAREKMIKRFQLIIDAYFEECSSMIEDLSHAGGNGDIETMTRAVHSIKSTSAALGAQKLSQLAASIEVRYKNNDITDWKTDKANLEQLFQGTKKEMTTLNKALSSLEH